MVNKKSMANNFDDFINVIKRDPKVKNKINDMIGRYNILPFNYQSKTGYDTLIQNVILKKIINIMGTTLTDLDKEIKMKISRREYLESKVFSK